MLTHFLRKSLYILQVIQHIPQDLFLLLKQSGSTEVASPDDTCSWFCEVCKLELGKYGVIFLDVKMGAALNVTGIFCRLGQGRRSFLLGSSHFYRNGHEQFEIN